MQTDDATATLSDWSADGTATLSIEAETIDHAMQGTLDAVLDIARGNAPKVDGAGDNGTRSLSVAIRGQGESYGEALYELLNDMLAQVDSSGVGLDLVRLDGLLETDTGGYSAWGYVLGEDGGEPCPVSLSVAGTPVISGDPGDITVITRLRRT